METEFKFSAISVAPLQALEESERLACADLGPPSRFHEIDRYLDTATCALELAGWACRLRLRADRWIVSLKGTLDRSGEEGGALHRRPEIEGPATDSAQPARWPPSDARHTVLRVTRGEPLLERVRLRQTRTERSVSQDGRPLGTLSLDRIVVIHGERPLGEMLVVELELAEGAGSRQGVLADALSSVPGLEPEPETKLERALQMVTTVGLPACPG